LIVKKRMKKLNLNRETLRTLDVAVGAVRADDGDIAITIAQPTKPFTTSQTISICRYCTTPLDTCPDPTVV
jgi:hypothetical protein